MVLVFILTFCGCQGSGEVISLQEVSLSDAESGTVETGEEVLSADADTMTGEAMLQDASDSAEDAAAGADAAADALETGDDVDADMGADTDASDSDRLLAVHVCGAVLAPGVYYLPADSRVCDAIEAAGGLTGEASDSSINQAAPIADGMQILVPTREEVSADASSGGITYADTFARETSSGDTGASADSVDERININTATREELMELPGIGEAKADAIIAYREENGSFGSVEEIMNVSGIKEASYAKLADRITVG